MKMETATFCKRPDRERAKRAVFYCLRSIEGLSDISGSTAVPETLEPLTTKKPHPGPMYQWRKELTVEQNNDFYTMCCRWSTISDILGGNTLERLRSGRHVRGIQNKMARIAAYMGWFKEALEVVVQTRLTKEQAEKLGRNRSKKIREMIDSQ